MRTGASPSEKSSTLSYLEASPPIPLIEQIYSLGSFTKNDAAEDMLKIATFEVCSTHFLGGVISGSFPDREVSIVKLP